MATRIRVFMAKLRGLFGRQRSNCELENEIQLHIQMLADRFVLQGMKPGDAEAAARRQFGNTTLLRERHYRQRTLSSLTTLMRDLHFGLRQLARNPILTCVAITSLALGIGANTAIFTAAKRVLFDTLPVTNPHQLRMLTWVSGHELPVPPVWGDVGPNEAGGLTSNSFSYPVFEEMRKRADAVESFVAFKDAPMTATIDGHAETISGELISGNAFQALGVKPELGRTLSPADDLAPGSGPVVVISDGFWTQRFARSPLVVGKSISLNGVPVTIIGVSSGRFAGLQMGSSMQVFAPLTMQPLILPKAQNGSVSLLDNPQSWWLQVLVRLRPDVSEGRAQGELDTTLRQAAMPVLKHTGDLDRFHLQFAPGDRGLDYLRAEYARLSYVLLAIAGFVLLLACLNLANLLLARSASRQRELSTRMALGAGRGSIIRQMLTEALLLSSFGGIAGLLLGYLGRNVVLRLLTNSPQPELEQVQFDWRVLLFTLGISIATGILFGLAPAWQAMRMATYCGLREWGGATVNRHRLWLDKTLVIGQIAVSATLLMGAGLFVHTLVNLNRIPLGFDSNNILLFRLDLPRTRYSDAQMATFFKQLEERLASLPGVRSVTVNNIGIIGDGHSGANFHVLGRPKEKDPVRVQTNGVGADFFETLGIPILQGRAFNQHDNSTSPKVAVVNRALAEKFFPNENAIGKTFETDVVEGPVQIVGIAADTRYADLRTDTPPTFYAPYVQKSNGPSRMMVELRTLADPASVLTEARTTVESLDADLPMTDVRTMKEQVRSTLADERALAQLAGGFSLLALVLASIGIYGMMAYAVTTRTGEIGLRMALGAQARQVLSRILREAFCLTGAGIVLGLIAALWLTRFIRVMLYGLGSLDALTLGSTAVLLIVVSLLAAFAPARRASRIDPIRALRHD
ncbi:ABC transporter permease [Terriglobus albidus]|uniref:ABC transporter permease n=1 Tax=Terriglobus albidus TaxID=1592106 RepID=UPI0021DFE1B1|nr:ABC transporter permease [Terriglobus albidus]